MMRSRSATAVDSSQVILDGRDSAASYPSRSRALIRRALRDPRILGSGTVIVIFVLLATFAPLVAPYSLDFMNTSRPLDGPSPEHWLGTDQLGRDILTRLIYGARLSLQIALYACVLALLAGVAIGAVSSYFGGWLEMILMRSIDVLLSFPAFVLAITVAAFIGPSLRNISIVIGIIYMPVFARLAYVTTLALRRLDYVDAARLSGASHAQIIARTILPNSLAPIIVQTSLSLGFIILTESGLSFLGVGVPPPAPSWGAQISEARVTLTQAPLQVVWPSIVIAMAILSFNIFGDALRDLLDPRSGSRS